MCIPSFPFTKVEEDATLFLRSEDWVSIEVKMAESLKLGGIKSFPCQADKCMGS